MTKPRVLVCYLNSVSLEIFTLSFSFSLPFSLSPLIAGPIVDDSNLGEDYQKMEYPVLYYHKTTGYYYEPVSGSLIL